VSLAHTIYVIYLSIGAVWFVWSCLSTRRDARRGDASAVDLLAKMRANPGRVCLMFVVGLVVWPAFGVEVVLAWRRRRAARRRAKQVDEIVALLEKLGEP
jgi:heme/copper-type cytochrome/quinol oxidase subunit 2